MLTDQERIAIAEWAGWTWHSDPRGGGWWQEPEDSKRRLHPNLAAEGLPAYESDPRAYIPLFERLARNGFVLMSDPVIQWRCVRMAAGEQCSVRGATPGEAVCRAVLAVIERESHLDKKAKP